MTTMTAVVRNGQIELAQPTDLPDGTEVEIRVPEVEGPDSAPEDERPLPPDEIARILDIMAKIEPLEMSDEERAKLRADRQSRKEWEKAHFEAHAEKLRRMWE